MTVSTDNALIPAIRFPEFNENWNNSRLSDISKVIDCKHRTPPYTDDGIAVVSPGSIRWGELDLVSPKKRVSETEYTAMMDHCKPKYGDLVFSRNQSLGVASYVSNDSKFVLGQDTVLIQVNNASSFFTYYLLQTHAVQRLIEKLSGGSTFSRINLKDIRSLSIIKAVSEEEQKKIANFLTSVDTKIQQLKRKRTLMQQYKKGVMQQIFSQQVRFKDDEHDFPDWKEKRFEDLFERVTRKNKKDCKNVMTISAQQGLINQQEYFKKSVSASDATGYYLMNKGEFAYNKSYSAGYPLGAIKKLNRYDEGVVSTLYICFKAKENIVPEFYEQYFEGGLLNREIQKIAQEGARNHGLLNVSVVEFFRDIVIRLPSIEEQQKIAGFLESIDKKIEQLKTQITQAETFKKGLLQQMFV